MNGFTYRTTAWLGDYPLANQPHWDRYTKNRERAAEWAREMLVTACSWADRELDELDHSRLYILVEEVYGWDHIQATQTGEPILMFSARGETVINRSQITKTILQLSETAV